MDCTFYLCDISPCIVYYEKVQGRSGFAVKVTTRKDAETEEFNTLPMLYGDVFSDKPEKVTFWYKSSKDVYASAILTSGDYFEDENAEETAFGETVVALPKRLKKRDS